MRRTASAPLCLLFALAACSGAPSSSEPQPSSSPGEPGSSSSPEPASSGSPSPPSYKSKVVRGWPDTSRNGAGIYSWDGTTCAYGHSCVMGFMHNGYGSGDVTFNIARVSGGPPGAGWTAATVAGHDGLYRRTQPREEEWLVEIDGTTIAIDLTTRRGTKVIELDEAHAIIDSMSTDERDTDLGFRLIFRLTTNDWDSG